MGKHLRLTRESTPVPVAEEERAQQRASIEFRMRRVKSDWTYVLGLLDMARGHNEQAVDQLRHAMTSPTEGLND